MKLSFPPRPRVALSAASSFTGCWIARAFHESGWNVLPVCSQPEAAYSGLRLARIRFLQRFVPVHFGCEAADRRLAAWIRQHRPHVWIHHHHFMENFRSSDYDLGRALRNGLEPLPGILDAVASGGGVGVVYSGSYFEPGELGQIWQAAAPTPYALSKHMVWDALRQGCESSGLRIAKIVIPNPVGPLENEDRLIPCMIRQAECGAALHLRAPGQFVDNLAIEDLAAEYVLAAARILSVPVGVPALAGELRKDGLKPELLRVSSTGAEYIRPSGRISTTLDWVQFAAAELLEKRLGLPPCTIECDRPADRTLVPAEAAMDATDWPKAWDRYAAWLRRGKGPRHRHRVERSNAARHAEVSLV